MAIKVKDRTPLWKETRLATFCATGATQPSIIRASCGLFVWGVLRLPLCDRWRIWGFCRVSLFFPKKILLMNYIVPVVILCQDNQFSLQANFTLVGFTISFCKIWPFWNKWNRLLKNATSTLSKVYGDHQMFRRLDKKKGGRVVTFCFRTNVSVTFPSQTSLCSKRGTQLS